MIFEEMLLTYHDATIQRLLKSLIVVIKNWCEVIAEKINRTNSYDVSHFHLSTFGFVEANVQGLHD